MTKELAQRPGTHRFVTEDRSYPAAWIIASRSYLVDRIVPDLAWIRMPKFTRPGGEFTLTLSPSAPARPTGRYGIKSRWKSQLEAPIDFEHDLLVDLRVQAPQNWSLFHNLHLPILCKAATEFGFDIYDVGLLLPANTPGYIKRSAAMFGLHIYCTDKAVDVPTILYEQKHTYLASDNGTEWIAPFRDRLNAARSLGPAGPPKRYFIARNKTRNIENDAEVTAFLAEHGFERICIEELSVAEQFAVFDRAEIIVTIHGAGMAPVMYRSDDSNLKLIVEICPIGHMTNSFRMRTVDNGVPWIGVQGRLKKDYLPGLYDLDKPFMAYSLDSFELDVETLRAALKEYETPTQGDA